MKTLVRRLSTGLYWNGRSGWVQLQDAEVFADSGKAIAYCIEKGMRDVCIVLSFGDSRYDAVLHPFGEGGHEPTSEELLAQSRRLKAKGQIAKEISRRHLEEMRNTLAQVHQTVAAMKEARKRVPFRRKE